MDKENEEKIKTALLLALKNIEDLDIKFDGVELNHLFLLHGIPELITHIVRGMFYFEVFDCLFKSNHFHSLVLSPSRTIEARSATVSAKVNKVKSYELQCGTITSSRRFWKPSANYVLTSDLASKKIYHDFFNLPENKLLLVGSPRLDKNISKYKKIKNEHDLIDHKYKRVFLALQTLPYDINEKMINVVLGAVLHSKYKLVVGFHPRDSHKNKEKLTNLCSLLSNNHNLDIDIARGDSLQELAKSDVCITYFSFLGIEAYALGCEVIALNITGSEWPYKLSILGIAQEATSLAELKLALQHIDSGESPLIENELLGSEVLRDGKSVSRIVEHVCANAHE